MAEVEVKAKVTNFDSIMQKLQNLGCVLSKPIIQEDKNFIPKGVKYENVDRDNVKVIRIRLQGGKIILTLKYKRGKAEMDCIEKEILVNDAKEAQELLEHLDYYHAMDIKKTRIKCKYKNYEICLDDVEGLGTYIEVEELIQDDEDAEAVKKEIWKFLQSLGIGEHDRVLNAYDTLMVKKGNYYKEK